MKCRLALGAVLTLITLADSLPTGLRVLGAPPCSNTACTPELLCTYELGSNCATTWPDGHPGSCTTTLC